MSPISEKDQLDPATLLLGVVAFALGLYLYLGRLDTTSIQWGNEAMYAYPPTQMLRSGDYLVPIFRMRPFLDKPPLAHWIIAGSYRLLGISVFSERLPSALAGLATVLCIGFWVRRRSGNGSGLLAALLLMFFFQFFTNVRTFAADAFLTLAVVVATFTLDRALRAGQGSNPGLGIPAGAALALAFGFKGLLGIVLPVGAVAAGLLIDRVGPTLPVRRGAWTLGTLLVLIAPWHMAMTQRLGLEFWRVFYWENQFLRGSTRLYQYTSRGPLYYVGVLAWAAFPWSLFLLWTLSRRRESSVFLGWLAFGMVFLSLLVMKREVYLLPILPAVAALVSEELGVGTARGRRLVWILGAAVAAVALAAWVRGRTSLADFASPGASLGLGLALALFLLILVLGSVSPGDRRVPFAAALAGGILLLSLETCEEGLGRFDPMPQWGERVKRECAAGCDGFLLHSDAESVSFYSGFEWATVTNPVQQIPEKMRSNNAYLITWTPLELELEPLPLRWQVVDRRPAFHGRWLSAILGVGGERPGSLSLIRIEGRNP